MTSKPLSPEPMDCQVDAGDSSLSSGEADELNDLLDHQDNGEEIKEDRLYKLDLFGTWRGGDDLDDEELADVLEAFKDVLDKRENGEDVDDDRLHCLELFARQNPGEELTEKKIGGCRGF
jgi:hypothetical protein